MNVRENSSRGPQAATGATEFPGYEKAFENIETPIEIALQRAKVAAYLAGHLADVAGERSLRSDRGGDRMLVDNLATMVFETLDALETLDRQYLDLYNAGCATDCGATR